MSPVRSSEPFAAYVNTAVSVEQSQRDVRDLLRSKGATGLQITESWHGQEAYADVRFAMPVDTGGYFAYRLRVATPSVEQVREQVRAAHGKQPTDREALGRGERQVWRLVYWWLKAQFEAAEAGLVALEEALMPWMELQDGRTAYETVREGLPGIAAGTKPLQLGPGR